MLAQLPWVRGAKGEVRVVDGTHAFDARGRVEGASFTLKLRPPAVALLTLQEQEKE